MRIARSFVVAVVIALLCATVPAFGHEEHALHGLTVLDSVEPEIEGIDVRIVHLDAPALVVTNDTEDPITILGSKGEPFLEIGPDGVRANVESPDTYLSIAPRREIVPLDVKATDPPRWALFTEERSWTWFDPRLRFEQGRTSWEVLAEHGGRSITIEGSFESLQGHGHFVTEMESPDIEGLDLRLTQGPIPAVFVRNDTGEEMEIPGDADEPFLRIGPGGVMANLRSPTYYTSGANTIAQVPDTADAGASPKWKKVSSHPVWAWLERRAAVPAEMYQRDALGTERRTVLEWTADYRLGGEPLPIQGNVDWIPPAQSTDDGDGSVPWVLAAAVGVLGLLAAAALLRKRPPARSA